MSDKKLDRRNFLKLGGLVSLAAASIPAFSVVGKLGKDNVVVSDEEYGGFYIRQHEIGDPPYKIDSTVYQRFSAENTMFQRAADDEEYIKKLMELPKPPKDIPGYRRENSAFMLGAAYLAYANNTASNGSGKHKGLLSINPPRINVIKNAEVYTEPWDRSHMTDQDIAKMVKTSAKYYGASLCGIAQLDERWIYSNVESFEDGPGAIEFFKPKEVKLPEGTLTLQEAKDKVMAHLAALEPDKFKETLIGLMKSIDPVKLGSPDPDKDPTTMIKMIPAKKLQEGMSNAFATMPKDGVIEMGKGLGMDIEIAMIDPAEYGKPHYDENDTLQIPETMNRVIVLAFEMDYDTVKCYPTTHGTASSMGAYSKMAVTAASLAAFIRELGYNAIPCGNQTGLSVPMAVDAGLGEMGRMGNLITPKYGPRVRLAKVITDMPMAIDPPISFGVKEFCDVCMKCAKDCPSQAILHGGQTSEVNNRSNNKGVYKWPIDAEKCLAAWVQSGSDCGVCMRTCPFNKPDSWLHEVTRTLIGVQSGNIDKLLLKMDNASGFGEPDNPDEYWNKETFIHIKE